MMSQMMGGMGGGAPGGGMPPGMPGGFPGLGGVPGAGAPPGVAGAPPQNIESLLQAGQQLAQQMQASNPELVDQLRRQMMGEVRVWAISNMVFLPLTFRVEARKTGLQGAK